MTWTKLDKYCLTNGTHYLSRVNLDATGRRTYELWTKDGKTCLGIRWCSTDSEATTAVAELKELADEHVLRSHGREALHAISAAQSV